MNAVDDACSGQGGADLLDDLTAVREDENATAERPGVADDVDKGDRFAAARRRDIGHVRCAVEELAPRFATSRSWNGRNTAA